MKEVSLESQLKALYQKASQKKQESGGFGDTLRETIDRVQAISEQADAALKGLSETQQEDELVAELANADSIHQSLMKEQHNLAALYNKAQKKTD